MCLNIGTPKNINFSFETNGKLMALGVPILKHIRVVLFLISIFYLYFFLHFFFFLSFFRSFFFFFFLNKALYWQSVDPPSNIFFFFFLNKAL